MRRSEHHQHATTLRGLVSKTLALVLLACPLQADDLFDLSLEELLEVKITSATLTPKPLQDAPASVSLFTAADIENLGVNSLEELLNFAPGYQSAKRGDGSLPSPYSARGRAIGTSSTEVIVLLDGRRIDNALSGGQSTTLPQLSLANVETIEFLRGPASSLYGSNAFLGVINITSQRDHNRIKVAKSSHGTTSAQAQFSQSNNSGLHLSLFAKTERSDGETFRVFDNFTNQVVAAKAPYQNLDLDLHLDWQQTEVSFLHTQRTNQGYLQVGNLSPDLNASSTNLTILSVKQSLPAETLESLALSAGLRRRHFDLAVQASPVGAFASISSPPSEEPLVAKAHVIELEPWLKLDGHYESNSSYDFNLLFGIDYRATTLTEDQVSSNYDLTALYQGQFPISYFQGEFLPGESANTPKEDILGAYLQLENTLDSGAAITVGLRYDDFSLASHHLSPRVTYVHPFLHSAFLKLIWGDAYRSPTLSERFVTPNNVQVGNPLLKPETVTTTEAVIGGNWKNAYLSLSLFENTFKNSITQDIVGGLRTFTNSDREKSSGLEAETIFQFDQSWSLRASATHFLQLPDSSFRDSRTLASLSLNRSAESWNANLSALYHSTQKSPTADPALFQALPSYAILNAKFRYRIAPDCTLSLSLSNLLDKNYYTATQSFIPGGVPNPGRSITLDFQFDW